MIADINECLRDHDCSDICVNIDGSFKCECDEGFILDSDNKKCTGMNSFCWLNLAKVLEKKLIFKTSVRFVFMLISFKGEDAFSASSYCHSFTIKA